MEIPGVEIKGSNSNRRAGAGTKRVRRFARASLVQFRQRSHGARHVVSVIAQGEAVTQAIPWLIVPVILISYLCFRFRASAS